MRQLAVALLAVVSLLAGLLLGEATLRLFFDRIDYLKPETRPDPTLGFSIDAHSAGHDAWGFRNAAVPDRAAIVTIGDSQTYGYAASMTNSWPSQLGRALGRDVYNLGLGGYGPAEYRHLLETRAFALEPEVVVVGLYLGNDFLDARRSVYARAHWQSYRAAQPSGRDPSAESRANDSGPTVTEVVQGARGLRLWLQRHSMFYRFFEEGPLGQAILGWRDRGQSQDRGCFVTSRPPHETTFNPERRLPAVSPSNPAAVEGLKLTLDFVREMATESRKRDIHFFVLLIPTKESVFVQRLDYDSEASCADVSRRLTQNEKAMNQRIKAVLDENDIDWVDPLRPLRQAVGQERLYPPSADGHPERAGYRIIAETLRAHLSPEPAK